MGINQGLGQGAGRYTPGDPTGKTPEELKQEQEKRAERIVREMRSGPSGTGSPQSPTQMRSVCPM